MGNKTGIVMALAILVIVGFSVALALDVPIKPQFIPSPVPSSGPEHVVNVTLWADASGWDFNHGTVNPNIVVPPDTLIKFTVIEEDGEPHTLTIAPGAKETSFSTTVLPTSAITCIIGHKSYGSIYITSPGEYTYWCTVHPLTMVGHIYCNTTAKIGKPAPKYKFVNNVSMNLQNNVLIYNGMKYPSLYIPVSTYLNMSVNDSTLENYSIYFNPGSGINMTGETMLINQTNTSSYGGYYFVNPGVYTYWNMDNTSKYGLIYVYTNMVNQTLYADVAGWNYSSNMSYGPVNPTLTFSQYTLVNFTIIDEDNLTHSIIINPGVSENTSYTALAKVTKDHPTASFLYFFSETGNYTYWDGYHPSTSVGLITVTNSTSAGSFTIGTQNIQNHTYNGMRSFITLRDVEGLIPEP